MHRKGHEVLPMYIPRLMARIWSARIGPRAVRNPVLDDQDATWH
jgi:hypothetical protein